MLIYYLNIKFLYYLINIKNIWIFYLHYIIISWQYLIVSPIWKRINIIYRIIMKITHLKFRHDLILILCVYFLEIIKSSSFYISEFKFLNSKKNKYIKNKKTYLFFVFIFMFFQNTEYFYLIVTN
jgi:hypothetical protein